MGKCDDVCRMQLTDVYVIQSADKIRNERVNFSLINFTVALKELHH